MMQNIFINPNEIKWDNKPEEGNTSIYGPSGKFFYKILTRKPEIHHLLINNEIDYTPKLIEYNKIKMRDFYKFTNDNGIRMELHEKDKNGDYIAYSYKYIKVDKIEIIDLLNNNGITKDKIKKLLFSIQRVFNSLYKNGYTYHDVYFKKEKSNIVWNRETNEPIILDLDSAVKYNIPIQEIKGKSDPEFHQVYASLQKTMNLRDMRFLGICIITNLFFSFAFGYYFDNIKKFINGDASTTIFALYLIEGKENKVLLSKRDLETLDNVLTDAFNILKTCIQENDVYHIITLNTLVDKIPRFYTNDLLKIRYKINNNDFESADILLNSLKNQLK